MTEYKITHMEFGQVRNVPMEFFLCEYTTTDEIVVNPWGFTLVQGGGKNILIDTAFDIENPAKAAMAAAAGTTNIHMPGEILATVGTAPEEIDAVILTHMHFDHASAIECYPNAVFYVQNDELEGWKEIRDNARYNAVTCFGMDLEDVDRILKVEKEGRLVRLDGDIKDVLPGISVKKLRLSHTFASQLVIVNTAKGEFIIAGDAANRPENLFGTKDHPCYIPNRRFAVGAVANTVKDYDDILALAGNDLNRIIMTHDDTKKDRYPHHTSELGLEIYEIA